MPLLSMSQRILAGLATAFSNFACLDDSYKCDFEFCAGLDWEVGFYDMHSQRIDTLKADWLTISFDPVQGTAKAAASSDADCVHCGTFILSDSTILMADRPIVSPEGHVVPAGSNLLEQPWKDMLGRGDYVFHFHQGVQFESGQYAFSITAPWVSGKTKTRVVLSDTSYLAVP